METCRGALSLHTLLSEEIHNNTNSKVAEIIKKKICKFEVVFTKIAKNSERKLMNFEADLVC